MALGCESGVQALGCESGVQALWCESGLQTLVDDEEVEGLVPFFHQDEINPGLGGTWLSDRMRRRTSCIPHCIAVPYFQSPSGPFRAASKNI